MPKLIATMAFPYAGQPVAAGDAFNASDKDAKILKLLKRAVDAPPPEKPRSYRTRAEEPETDAAETPVTAGRRRYQRRDLEPESN